MESLHNTFYKKIKPIFYKPPSLKKERKKAFVIKIFEKNHQNSKEMSSKKYFQQFFCLLFKRRIFLYFIGMWILF